MDIRPLRSPIYVVLTAPSGAVSAKLELTIDSTLRYTIIKDCTAGSTVTFEIAELARDYIQTPQCWNISGVSTFFANSTGTAFPICLYMLPKAPSKIKLSGKV